jgi:hypothetical protein
MGQTTVLTWLVGASVALTIATLGMGVTLSFQMGTIAGQLSVLIGHVQMH